MADYWLAPALEQFRAEINALYPNRDKRSDGWIGDKYHAGGKSDHNPSKWPPSWKGVVRAFDADNDVAVGKNAQSLADYLATRLGKHPALMSGAYLIYNGRIISTDRLNEGWRKYSGKNPHTGHIHISVGTSAAGYNSTAPWGLGTPSGDNDMDGSDREYTIFRNHMQRFLAFDGRPRGAGADSKLGLTVYQFLETLLAQNVGIVKAVDGGVNVDLDENALAERIAGAIPDNIAERVADVLATRLKD